MKKSILKFLPLAILSLTFTACDEDGDGSATSAEAEQKLANYFLDAEAIGSSVYTIMDLAKRDTSTLDTIMVSGATVIKSGTTLSIDYGAGVVGSDGVTRTGMITATESGDYFTNGGSLTAAFSGFSVDTKTIGGAISVTNKGNDLLEISITNLDYNSEFTYNATKDMQWVSGFSTVSDNNDDKFDVSGSSTGSETAGNSLSAVFTSPLKFDRSCQYGVTAGIIHLTLTGDSLTFNDASLNFIASDSCNNQVIITVTNTDGASITTPQTFSGF